MNLEKKKQAHQQPLDTFVPPHSVDAEAAVLGSLMIADDSQSLFEEVSEIIKADDFYIPMHAEIFKAMQTLYISKSPTDVLLVSAKLKERGIVKDAQDEIYLFNMAKNTPCSSNAADYANLVKDFSLLRKTLTASEFIRGMIIKQEGLPVREIIDKAEKKVLELSTVADKSMLAVPMTSLAAKAVDRIESLFHRNEAITGITTGFKELDEITCGLQQSDLIILAGRPSMGKTSLAMNIAENAAVKSKKPILIFSLEMPGDSLAMRMISSLGGIDQHRIRTGKLSPQDWPRIITAISFIQDAKIFVDDTCGLTPQELKSRARRATKEYGKLGLIIIDYLQLMQVPDRKDNRVAEISEISRSLKAIAKEFEVPVIALSQLNRSVEQRQDKRPVMSDLRDSGAIEQDADLVMFVYRDEMYNKESEDKGFAEIILSKHRNGPVGTVRLKFNRILTKFENPPSGIIYTAKEWQA